MTPSSFAAAGGSILNINMGLCTALLHCGAPHSRWLAGMARLVRERGTDRRSRGNNGATAEGGGCCCCCCVRASQARAFGKERYVVVVSRMSR